MARRDKHHSIRLPAGAKRQAADAPSDEVDRAIADISASAEIRDRKDLPSKVKVITPQVIMNIVRGITDTLGMEVDRDEFNQIVMQQTQMEMQLAQSQEKLEQYKSEYKKVYDALQQTRELLAQVQEGGGGAEEFVQQYEAQINELQQRNADAVDIYMNLQQQLDETTEQYGLLEQHFNELQQRDEQGAQALEQDLHQANERIAALESELAQARQESEAAAATDAEQLQGELQSLRRQLKDAERARSQNESLETDLEQLRNSEGAWLEEKRRLAAQLSNETNNRRAAEEKLQALESGAALPPAAKQIEERAKKAEVELEKVRGELKQLQDELGKSGNAARELGAFKRKFEGVETELESLRAAEGKWLEEKRRMAAQLSNETNLRRDLEAKLQGELDQARSETESVKKKLNQ